MPARAKTFINFLSLTLFLFSHPGARAQDTLQLTVPQAEQIFLQKNLTLLADHYNVDINKALVLQAKAWDNPVVNSDQTLYDGKFFRHTNVNGTHYGEVFIQVQQLIRTAGKIKKQAKMAEDNVTGSEAQFNDLLRSLRYTLTTDMNELARLQNTASVYANESASMKGLAKGMDEMLKLGDVSQKENVRIKALLFSLEGDLSDNLRQQYDIRQELATLLQLKDSVWIQSLAMESISPDSIRSVTVSMLKDSALANRPDLAALRTGLLFQQHNLQFQQSLRYPDVTLGTQYDRINSYVPHYFGLDISVPLPVFNRNRGNINAAGFAVRQSSVQVEQLQNEVGNEVATAWLKLNNSTAMLNADDSQLQQNYDSLMRNMVNSYRQRQVSLIEFVDFFDSYRETRARQWQLVANQRNAAAELNYVTNQNIISL